ncbi:tetratricopeptide repeat protein [Limisphaera sp. VF-2]|uniref:tetratricopeptide repeat protein n=1 Tax=Limisphaera sp. VF-2 TaxID=3400418 RepID=UPI001755C2C0
MSEDVEPMDESRRRLWLWLGAVAVGLALIGAGVWWGRPAYRQYKERRYLQLADRYLEGGDLRNGMLSLRQALAANPRNAETARRLAALLTELRSPLALGWWRRVVELEPTAEHRLRLVSAALLLENPPYPIATQTLEEMVRLGETNLARFHVLASQLALQTRRIDAAVAHLTQAVALEPTNRLHRLNLATLQVQSTNSAVAERARQELLELADSPEDPHLALLALRSLVTVSLTQGDPLAAERFSARLLQLPGAGFGDKVQHLTVLVAAGRPETNAWLRQLQQEAGTNAARVTQLASWLTDRQRAQEARDWLETLPLALRTNPPVTLAVADVLVALQDWSGLEAWLAPQHWEEQDAMRLALLTRAARERGRRDLAEAYWRRVLNAPGGRGESLAAVAQVLTTWGWKSEADEVLWVLVKRAPWHEWAWQSLVQNRYAAGDTAGLYQVYAAMLEAKPNVPEIKNNVAALGLLLGRDLDRARRLAREVYLADTNNPVFVSTYAFSLHQQGDTKRALELLESLPESVRQRPEVAVYMATMLAAQGRWEEARAYATRAADHPMLPEEKRMVESVLRRAPPAG